jgi:GT2 family glycosyltransferase
MRLSIIIIHFKTPYLLLRCIESIYKTVHQKGMFEIIVVDNHSEDNSEIIIKEKFEQVIWIQKNENDGFGRANNIGIHNSRGEYVLLLNSDMILLNKTVDKCIDILKNNHEIGAIGCQLLNENGTIQKSTYTGNGKSTDILKNNLILDYLFKFNHKKSEIEALMGSFLLIPRKVLDKSGFFDPDFFMYSEEIDLCRRIKKQNYKLYYCDEVQAIHKHGGSSSNIIHTNQQKFLSNALLQFKSNGIINYSIYHIIFCFNSLTNFFAMWLLDKNYRKEYWYEQKYYFSNINYYIKIPFQYTRKTGNGKRILRRSQKSEI